MPLTNVVSPGSQGACLSISRGRDRGRFPLSRGGADAVGLGPNEEATTMDEGKSARSRRVGKERGVCGVARLARGNHHGRRRAPCQRGSREVLRQAPRLPVVERSAMVTFTAKQMFDLVNDVGRYPEFLPWCTGARVADRSDTERVASVKVARGILRTEFTTRNTLRRDAQILMHLIDGPFRDLIGEWRFEAIGERGSRDEV